MRMDRINTDGIAIPHEVIEGWKRRGTELDSIIANAQREKADITRKLEAVAILAPEIVDKGAGGAFQLTAPGDSSGKSVVSEIAATVNEGTALLLPKDIRRLLHQREGVPSFSDSYFYTALKRAADQNLITKVGDRYGPKKNPEAETSGS